MTVVLKALFFLTLNVLASSSVAVKIFQLDEVKESYPYLSDGSVCTVDSGSPKNLNCFLNVHFSDDYFIQLGVGLEGHTGSTAFKVNLGINTSAYTMFKNLHLPNIDIGKKISSNLAGTIDLTTMSVNYPTGFPETAVPAVFELSAEQLASGFCLSSLRKLNPLISSLSKLMVLATSIFGGDICIQFPNVSSNETELRFELVVEMSALHKNKVNIAERVPKFFPSFFRRGVQRLLQPYMNLFPDNGSTTSINVGEVIQRLYPNIMNSSTFVL